jgi:TM2 domain-containing membrane protein YozV
MAVGAMLIGVATVLGLLHAPWFLLVAPACFAATLMAATVTVAHDAHLRLRTRGVDPAVERKIVAFAGARPQGRTMNGPAAPGGAPTVVYQAPAMGLVRVANRRRGDAALLALLLGSIGAHKLYTGRPVLGLLYFAFFWTGIPLLLGVLEAVRYVTMSRQAFDLEYNARLL